MMDDGDLGDLSSGAAVHESLRKSRFPHGSTFGVLVAQMEREGSNRGNDVRSVERVLFAPPAREARRPTSPPRIADRLKKEESKRIQSSSFTSPLKYLAAAAFGAPHPPPPTLHSLIPKHGTEDSIEHFFDSDDEEDAPPPAARAGRLVFSAPVRRPARNASSSDDEAPSRREAPAVSPRKSTTTSAKVDSDPDEAMQSILARRKERKKRERVKSSQFRQIDALPSAPRPTVVLPPPASRAPPPASHPPSRRPRDVVSTIKTLRDIPLGEPERFQRPPKWARAANMDVSKLLLDPNKGKSDRVRRKEALAWEEAQDLVAEMRAHDEARRSRLRAAAVARSVEELRGVAGYLEGLEEEDAL